MPKRFLFIGAFVGFFIMVFGCAALAQSPPLLQPMADAQFPSLESAIRIKGPVTFCNEIVPIHKPEVRERLEKELLLMLWDRAQVILWLKRTGRYFPYIEGALAKAEMPDDLKFVAVIESALRPHAGSRRGAQGVWQFIASTGRNYGLTVDNYIDERRNYHLATTAALQYLSDLHEMFDTWTLACAAYNMGEKGLETRIKEQQVGIYYHLDLPTETERYILRAVAAKLILSDPQRYGFNLQPDDYYLPHLFDRVILKHKYTAPIVVIAQAAGTYYKKIRDLNPQFLSDVVPGGEQVVFLPKGSAARFAKNYEIFIQEYRKQFRGKTYIVKRGDTLTAIAREQKVSYRRLLRLNNLHNRSVIHPGQKLILMK